MFKILTCLATEHDLRLVLVAGLVCFGGCFTAFRLYSRMRTASGRGVRAAWVLLTGLVAGCSVWATHFIAMLSYDTGLRAGFMPLGTLASLLIAGIFMTAAFAAAAFGGERAGKAAGGILAGFGVAAMHYTGMSAYMTEGVLSWDRGVVAGSIVVGVSVAMAAMFVARDAGARGRQLLAALMLTVAICSLHFAGMGAITIVPDASIDVPAQLLSSVMMTLSVVLIVGLIILGGLGAVLIEGGANAQALSRIRRLADAAYEGIVVVRGDRIQDANAAFCALIGAEVSDLAGKTLVGELLMLDGPVGLNARREGRLCPGAGDAEIPVEAYERVLEVGRGGEGDLMVLAVRDLRERRSAEEKIRYLAEHDGLTGLTNRNVMQTRLAATLERVAVTGESLSVICIDLDHFKEANDLHGHMAGDAVLAETARRLRQAVAAPSFAARLGGDEFVVVQVGAGQQPAAAGALSAELLDVLGAPVLFEGQELRVGASLGVSLYPDDGDSGEALLANADMALYRAKEDGRGAYCFFKREMDETIRERRALARELRQAIVAEELVVHYQPLARAEDGEVCGFEALVRWKHPTRGMVGPMDFIPVAEESGLILPLGEWVLRRACADAARMEKPLRMAVNLSPVQLHQPNLANMVHEVLLETGLAPRRLELEITETALFKDFQRALDNLRRLKALGVRIAMDDFGTGFSSLSTLQSFPFDKIKIDKSFVENIHRHDRATAIVRAVLSLGRSLEIPVTAEGVETAEQLEFLRGEACAEVQGYAIGRPTPLESLDDWTERADRKKAAAG